MSNIFFKINFISYLIFTLFISLTIQSVLADKYKYPLGQLKKVKLMYDDPTFENLTFNSRNKNKCSPNFTNPNWVGIKINSPKIIYTEGDVLPIFPVCALIQIKNRSSQINNNVIVELVDVITKKIYTDDIKDIETDPSPVIKPKTPEIPMTEEEISDIITVRNITINLKEQLIFPDTNAAYDLRLLFRGLISNTVRVEIKSLN